MDHLDMGATTGPLNSNVPSVPSVPSVTPMPSSVHLNAPFTAPFESGETGIRKKTRKVRGLEKILRISH